MGRCQRGFGASPRPPVFEKIIHIMAIEGLRGGLAEIVVDERHMEAHLGLLGEVAIQAQRSDAARLGERRHRTTRDRQRRPGDELKVRAHPVIHHNVEAALATRRSGQHAMGEIEIHRDGQYLHCGAAVHVHFGNAPAGGNSVDHNWRKYARDAGRCDQDLAEQRNRLWAAMRGDGAHVPHDRPLSVEVRGHDIEAPPGPMFTRHGVEQFLRHVSRDVLLQRLGIRERVSAEETN